MIKASIGLQDLRRKIYLKAKSDKIWRLENAVASAGTGGVGPGFMKLWDCSTITEFVIIGLESAASLIGLINEAGAGNVTMGAGLRPRTKVLDEPPDTKVRAPVLDPTCGGGAG
jgi:hypothetical protein